MLLVKALHLDRLTEISEEFAQNLSQHPGRLLSLNGLISITPAIAQHFANHKGYLSLEGVNDISDEVAVHLAKHEGGVITKPEVRGKIEKFRNR